MKQLRSLKWLNRKCKSLITWNLSKRTKKPRKNISKKCRNRYRNSHTTKSKSPKKSIPKCSQTCPRVSNINVLTLHVPSISVKIWLLKFGNRTQTNLPCLLKKWENSNIKTCLKERKDKKNKRRQTMSIQTPIRNKMMIERRRKPDNGTIGKMSMKKVQETETKEDEAVYSNLYMFVLCIHLFLKCFFWFVENY